MASSAEATRWHAGAALTRPTPPPQGLDDAFTPPCAVADRSLASLIEGQIIPRLMLAHGVATVSPPFAAVARVGLDDVDALVSLTLASDAGDVLAQVERFIARGLGIDAIMVELLAPTARRLGTLWDEDRCDFVEVTMGLWRLQEVVRELSTRFAPPFDIVGGNRPRRALFVALPGDRHDFGAAMIGEVFHHHGWDVETAPGADMAELLAEVGRHHYDLVGLTVSCDCHSARLTSAILSIRSVSRNPRVRVMVGGRLFADDPALAESVGACGTAPDALQALVVAEALVDAMADQAIAA